MARVPTGGVPSIASVGAPGGFQRINSSAAAFGAGDAQGKQSLAAALERAGNISADIAITNKRLETEAALVGAPEATEPAIRFQRQRNDADVDAAYSEKFAPAFRELYKGYYSLQGKDALDKMPEITEKMNNLRNDVREGLANDVQRHAFDSMTRRRLDMELDGMSRYADQQFKVYRANTSKSFLKNQLDQAADFWNDEQRFGMALGTGIAEIDRFGMEAGESAEMVRDRTSQFISAAWVSRIERAVVQDPLMARDMYAMALGEKAIDAAVRPQLEHRIKSAVQPVLARSIADQAMKEPLPAGVPESERDAFTAVRDATRAGKPLTLAADYKSPRQMATDVRANLGDWIKRGEALAEKTAPNDPVFRDMVVSRIQSYVSTQAVAAEGLERAARDQLVLASFGQNGVKPTTLEQLLSTPELKLAWSNSQPGTQQAILNAIERNSKGTNPPMSEAALSTYYQLAGMAATDPARFASENLAEHFGTLPHELTLRLINQQASIDKNAAKDQQKSVSIARARSITRPQVLAAGIKIPTKPGEASKVYDQFVGRLVQSMDDFYQTNKKMPTDLEVRDMGNALLVEGAQSGSGWLWDTKKKAFEVPPEQFYVPVPSKERTKIIDDYRALRGGTPSDAEIQRIYTAAKLKERK